jgi:hypothetical protein
VKHVAIVEEQKIVADRIFFQGLTLDRLVLPGLERSIDENAVPEDHLGGRKCG